MAHLSRPSTHNPDCDQLIESCIVLFWNLIYNHPNNKEELVKRGGIIPPFFYHLSLLLCVYLSFSLYLSVCLCISQSLYFSLSLSVSVCLFLSLCCSVSLFVSLFFCV